MQYRIYVNGKPFDVVIQAVGETGPEPGTIQAPIQPTIPVQPAAPGPVRTAEERVLSPFPGTVTELPVSVGQTVEAGQVLVVVEAMKMQNDLVAPRRSVVKQILVSKGTLVSTDDVLVVLT
ncbi:MAG: biotin/lipoyl-binding protein [Treponema sp.]|nr:biotin/lipoyl-binding protein [Treponema sp.]